ncbi:MAG TPA: hypothetical protein PK141_17935 [Polyangiaceae bacterium]|nr:hypothetical protein [Polyangiaceae bacterium]
MARFEYVAEGSAKCWEISVTGRDVATHWGGLGNEGQRKTAACRGRSLRS